MIKFLKIKETDMGIQILAVGKSILAGASQFLTTSCGKVVALMAFFTALGLGSIAGLIHITIGFVLVDMLFGLAVTVKNKGWSHILSARLRDSLVKIFFYLLIIIGLFLIESHLVDGYILTSKLAFALIAGVELWSIMANMLVLMPNIPVLKLLKNMLSQEIAKKTGVSETELNKQLNESENDTKTNI